MNPSIDNDPEFRQRVMRALDQATAKLEAAAYARREPIAVVGIGCRFPGGADSPDTFWERLSCGFDAIDETPADRWDVQKFFDPNIEAEGKIYTNRGGFLDNVDQFDARFFEISPREAASMDPQQRLLLEVSWEALENAGIVPDKLQKTKTGVYIGVTALEYGSLLVQSGHDQINAWFGTGNVANAMAGRIAHTLGLQGPAIAVDTACSSSLVAVHLACQGLRQGECDTAIVGGVNLMLSPEAMIALCQAKMLAPDGVCKTFDAAADGYVRGEGCGVVLLKRLSDARRDGDNIVALVRGSAVNQDGPSSGFTVPNGIAQRKLIQAALEFAQVQPSEVDYLEAHGTGTSLGDPIELAAAAAVLAIDRPSDRPLFAGSVKTNMGHLESAAGIAGLIKTVLALKHQVIPQHLHLRTPNPHVDWDGIQIQVPTEAIPWPQSGTPIANVSSFGASGTNAHVVLEAAPQEQTSAVLPNGRDRTTLQEPHLLVLSAKSENALRELAEKYVQWLPNNSGSSFAFGEICRDALELRTHFEYRLCVIASSTEVAISELSQFLRTGDRSQKLSYAMVSHDSPAAEESDQAIVLATNGEDSRHHQLTQLANAFILGRAFAPTYPGPSRDCCSPNRVSLPTYPWQHKRHWFEVKEKKGFADDWNYEVAWRSAALQRGAGRHFSHPAKIRTSVEQLSGTLTSTQEFRHYWNGVQVVEQRAAQHATRAIAALRSEFGREFDEAWSDPDALASLCGIADQHRSLFVRVREIFEEGNASFQNDADLPPLSNLLESLPEVRIELILLDRCGDHLLDVMRGKHDPLQLLFPNDGESAAHLYEASHGAQVMNRLVHETVREAIRSLPEHQALKVLEVGAGTGGTTSSLLPILPSDRCEYVYTDISPGLLAAAQRKFQNHSFVNYRVLDIEKPPQTQGFEEGQFDLIVAANVLHATRDLGQTVEHVRQLLAPQGMLLLLEGTPSLRFIDLIFGMTDGWWRFTDQHLRAAHPLIDGPTWEQVLNQHGFCDAASLRPDEADPGILTKQTVVVAKAAGALSKQGQAGESISNDETAASKRKSSWFILDGESRVGANLVELLKREGSDVAIDYVPADSDQWLDDFSAGLQNAKAAREDGGDLQTAPQLPRVVYLRGLTTGQDGSVDGSMEETCCRDLLELSQAIVRSECTVELSVVTSGAVAAIPGDVLDGISQSPLWGFARVIATEHPELAARRIDLDPKADSDHLAQQLLDELLHGDSQELAWRDQTRLHPRLTRCDLPHIDPTWSPSGTWVISGGLGGLGWLTAKMLVRRGLKSLALISRSPATASRLLEIEQMREQGVQIELHAADISNREELETALLAVKRNLLPIRGIVHAAGVVDDGVFSRMSICQFQKVLAPKVRGALNLHDLTTDCALDAFVMFSTASSLLGSAAQANHAAANAFLDQFAWLRRSQNLPAQSINWGPWSEVGAAARSDIQHRHAQKRIGSIDPVRGIETLERILCSEATQVAVLPVDWREQKDLPQLFAELVPSLNAVQDSTNAISKEDASLLLQSLQSVPKSRQQQQIMEHVKTCVAEVLGQDRKEISSRDGFMELGLDSLSSVELRNHLQRSLQLTLPTTLAFDYPTSEKLADYLLDQLNLGGDEGSAAASEMAHRFTMKERESSSPSRELMAGQGIAIIGMGCRFPGGVTSPSDFWNLLASGKDAITDVPHDRWDIDAWHSEVPRTRGKMITRCGGFLDGIDLFDSQFFGIAPNEADFLDPQHRLLLETTWEALERGAIAPSTLRGSCTGVFVGISSNEYAERLADAGPDAINYYWGSGNAGSVAAGRIAFSLDLTGPALAIDTACSSSLVAVHQACTSLGQQECDQAIVGGVNVMLTPTVSINHSQARMLAPDGRCKTFDSSADGFVRSEGCGVVILKRVEDALRDGDVIQAVIRGSATNQDGHTSGITVPNGHSQQAVIEQALRNAAIDAAEIDLIEAHGTGTSLGDPIELNALEKTFGAARRDRPPLWVSSVKTNIGHAEAAAGIAGLIKAVLSIQHQSIPAHLHLNEPTSKFEWTQSKLDVPRELIDWKSDSLRRAGVSSFGFGGTNAHVVLEQAPNSIADHAQETPVEYVLPISARNPESLRALVRQLSDELSDNKLRDSEHALAEVAATLAAGRDHFRHRIAFVASSIEQAVDELDAIESKNARPESDRRPESNTQPCSALHGIAQTDPPQVAFLYTGQGSQFVGMGRELMATEQVFRESMQRCEELLRPHLDLPLLDVIYSDDQSSPLNETKYTQPALFAIEYSLTELWKSWGITPDIVIGHSVGEYAAACAAGIFDLATGLELIAARGRLMQALPSGSMAAVFADRKRVVEVLQNSGQQVELAALNGPSNTVISGSHDAMDKALAAFDKADVHFQPLTVSHAFHSNMMEPMLSSFAEIARSLSFCPPNCQFISNTSGDIVTRPLSADYWCRHLRQPVEFVAGMESLAKMDCKLFVEIGPRPVLTGMGRQCLVDRAIRWLPSLQPGKSDRSQMNHSLSQLYVDGANVNWRAVSQNSRRIELPTYPFQRRRHWAIGEVHPNGQDDSTSNDLSTIIGEPLESASHPGEFVLQGTLGRQQPNYLADHQVFGQALLPGSCYLSMVQSAALKIWNRHATEGTLLTADSIEIHDIAFLEPMCVDDIREAQICVDQSTMTWKIHSRLQESRSQATKWMLHATGRLSIIRSEKPHDVSDNSNQRMTSLHELRQRIESQLSTEEFYADFTDLGVSFGPAFQAVREVWIPTSDNGTSQQSWEILGKLELSKDRLNSTNGLHPIIVDAACQLAGALRHSPATFGDERRVYIQSGIDQFRQSRGALHEAGPSETDTIWAHVELLSVNEIELTANITMFDECGERVAEILGLRARVVKGNLSGRSLKPYVVQWQPQARRDSGHLLATADSAEFLRSQMHVEFGKQVVTDYQELLAQLEALSPMYVQQALKQLGCSDPVVPSSPLEVSKLQAQLGVLPKYSQLFSRLLNCLSESGWVSNSADVLGRMQKLRQRWPSSAEAELLERCGHRLADVLRGVERPLDLIFPNGDKSAASRVYGESAGVVAMTSIFGRGIQASIANLPKQAGLRVLEIGAGTGGTTRNVLPILPSERTSYVFTDISSHFLREAQSKFVGFGFVEFQTLDIERSPLEQGFEVGEFDIVIASNVLHATRNLPDTLKHVQMLLKPLGQLWLLENVLPSRWVELIWGLTDGWWRFDDHLRSDDPLLTTDGWTSALGESGFRCTSTASVAEHEYGHLARQAIIVAEADSATVNTRRRFSDTDGESFGSGQRWLLVSNDDSVSQSLASELTAAGDDVVRVRIGAESRQLTDNLWEIDSNDCDSYQRLFDDLNSVDKNACDAHLQGVIYLRVPQDDPSNLHPAELEKTTRSSCVGLCRLLQTIHAQGYAQPPRTWLVTSGAQVVREDDLIHPSVSPLWSVGAVAGLETPHLWGGMIDLDLRDMTEVPQGFAWGQIVEELRTPDREDQLAFRANSRYASRVVQADDSSGDLWRPRRTGAYLVTGGLGALGLEIANWLVENGAQQLILVGRSGLSSDQARSSVEKLRKCASVEVAAVDVADFDAMSQLLSPTNNRSPIVGVIHAAGQPGYKPLLAMTDADFDDVFAAKVAGAWTLHLLTQGMKLDCFLMCSSMVSLWGSKGQSHYAAANQFMDALAQYRRSSSAAETATSVNWGPMLGGMLRDDTAAEVQRMGVAATAMPHAVSHLSTLVGSQQSQIALVNIDWKKFKALYESHRERPLFDQVSPSMSKNARTSNGDDQDLAAPRKRSTTNLHLFSLSAAQRRSALEDVVQESLREVLGDVEIPDWQTGFFELGMDSLTAMDFRTRLETKLSLELPSTLAFDYPNVNALTQLLQRSLQEQMPKEIEGGVLSTCSGVTVPSLNVAPSTRQMTISEIEDLSDADVELMLVEKLMLLRSQPNQN